MRSTPRARSPQADRRAAYLAAEAQVRAVVMDRDGHACVICGSRDRVTFHHCLPRSAGGSSIPIGPHQAIAACGSGTSGCHGMVERAGREQGWAYRLGYLARHGLDPSETPDGTRLVWGHAARLWWELWPSGVRTARPDLPRPAPVDLAGLG